MNDHPAKTTAQALRAHLTAHGLNPLGQQRALNVIAALHGTDWNTLSAQPHRPRLAPPADAEALRRALQRYDVEVTPSWAVAAVTLLGGPGAAPSVELLNSSGSAAPLLPPVPLLDRDAVYRAIPLHRRHPVHIDRRARLTTPWPLLPLPDQVSPVLRQQLWRARTLEWTPETGLLIDGTVPVMPLPGLGPEAQDETVKAWEHTLNDIAPYGSVDAETRHGLLTRLTVARTLDVPACFTYQGQTPYGRRFMRDARWNLTISYDTATHAAAQARGYDAFIKECALDGRGSAALGSRHVHRLTELERQVLRTFPDGRTRIRDHIKYWQVEATKQLVLTYEPYLSPKDPTIQTEADAFRQAGWTVTVRRSVYAPSATMIMLLAPA